MTNSTTIIHEGQNTEGIDTKTPRGAVLDLVEYIAGRLNHLHIYDRIVIEGLFIHGELPEGEIDQVLFDDTILMGALDRTRPLSIEGYTALIRSPLTLQRMRRLHKKMKNKRS